MTPIDPATEGELGKDAVGQTTQSRVLNRLHEQIEQYPDFRTAYSNQIRSMAVADPDDPDLQNAAVYCDLMQMSLTNSEVQYPGTAAWKNSVSTAEHFRLTAFGLVEQYLTRKGIRKVFVLREDFQ